MKTIMNGAFGLLGSILFISPVCAQETCPVEVKILLSSPETEPAILALGFKKKTESQILADAGVSIDWERVAKIASIRSIKWQTGTQSPHGKLALELWQWRTGKILELSSKSPSAADTSKYKEMEELLKASGLSSNADQATKTTTVLESLANLSLPRR
jgi:hypothetical protein